MPGTPEAWCHLRNRRTRPRFRFYRCYRQRVRKRRPLRKVFTLGSYTLDIQEIDLLNLIGGSLLTVLYTLAKNRIGIDLDILTDTGANGFTFIDTTLTDQLCRGLNLQLTALPCTIQAKGYNSQKGQVVSYCLTLNLIIEGRRQYNILFIVLKLGAHKAILSCKWFEYFYVNPDVAGQRLIWPPENTLTPLFIQLIQIDRNDLVQGRTSRSICEDIVQRDRAFAVKDKR
jgi:hypothetical protein